MGQYLTCVWLGQISWLGQSTILGQVGPVDPNGIIQESFKANPTNVYGLLVGVLVMVILGLGYYILTQDKKITKLSEIIRESDKESMSLLAELTVRIGELQISLTMINHSVEGNFKNLKDFLLFKSDQAPTRRTNR